jgi:phage gp36-like protein
MSYCTQDDLLAMLPELELSQLTTESGEEADAAVVAGAIAAADAEIDAYLGVRYQLPLPETPARVKALSVDLTIYQLYRRRSLVTEARRLAYEDAVKFLQLVAKGLAIIEGAAGPEPPGAVQDVTEMSSQTRIFDRDSLKDW